MILFVLALASCGGGDGSPGDSAQPQPEGGEKSIEGFGSEASGPDRAALLGVFHGYLGAIAAGDDAAACTYLATAVQGSLEQLAPGRLKGKGCVAILPRLLAPAAAGVARQQAEGKVTRVRVEGDRAFVVFHAPGAKLYQLTLVREGGHWKTATVAASVLVPSAATLGR